MLQWKWMFMATVWAALVIGFVLAFAQPTVVVADGTEELGPPVGITLTRGSGIIAFGVGISDTMPVTFAVTVPVNSEVKQVLMYWSGGMVGDLLGSDVITVSSQRIQGQAIGGPTFFFRKSGNDFYFSAFRADITARSMIQPGSNLLTIESQPFSGEKDGVGVMVIYDDGSGDARVDIRDGIDMAYHGFAPNSENAQQRRFTIPQTFTFPALDQDRRSRLSMFFGSVAPEEPRSSIFTVTIGSEVVLVERNLIGSFNGAQWDTVNLDFVIPTGATSMTVEAVSPPNADPNGASFSWIASGFFLLDPIADVEIRKFTNANDADDPNGSDMPEIAPSEPVTWTYLVTNTGTITLTQTEVVVSDSQPGITPTLQLSSDDGDLLLAPGESWRFIATGVALDLVTAPGNATVVQGCTVGTISRPTYRNIGRVTIPGATASNPSHYCNPVEPTGLEEAEEPVVTRMYIPFIAR